MAVGGNAAKRSLQKINHHIMVRLIALLKGY